MFTTTTRRSRMTAAALWLAISVNAGLAQEDDNPRVADVVAAVASTKHHGEAMGLWPDGARPTSWTAPNHYQGIARSHAPGIPFLYISQSGDGGEPDSGDYYGSVLIAAMESRNQRGERFRSNRLDYDFDTEHTDPPSLDRGVTRIDFNTGFLNYEHAGGMAVIGDVLVIPLEGPRGQSPASSIAFYDISVPNAPVLLHQHYMTHSKAGVVAITKLPDGRYLMLIGAENDGERFWGCTSNVTSLRDPALHFTEDFTWEAGENDFGGGFSWPQQVFPCEGKTSYQNLTFVTQRSDGQLYLIGTTKRGSCALPYGLGDDWMDIFRVDYTYPASLRLVAQAGKHLYTEWQHAGFNGNLIAGGGVHVTPSGQVLLYACNHSNSFQPPFNLPGDPLFMTEFRIGPVTQAVTCGPSSVYIELFDDRNLSDRSIIYEYDDRYLENWGDLGEIDGFNDKASSIRWCAPTGTCIRFHENPDWGGATLTFEGTGKMEVILDLDDYGWNDRISSLAVGPFTLDPCGTRPTTVSPTIYVQPWCGALCDRRGTPLNPMGGIYEALSVWGVESQYLNFTPGEYHETITLREPMTINAPPSGDAIIGLP